MLLRPQQRDGARDPLPSHESMRRHARASHAGSSLLAPSTTPVVAGYVSSMPSGDFPSASEI